MNCPVFSPVVASNTQWDGAGRTGLESLHYSHPLLKAFKHQATTEAAKRGFDIQASGNRLPLYLFDWDDKVHNGRGVERSGTMSVDELLDHGMPQVRVIFAPRDSPVPEFANGLVDLFVESGLPSAFVAESLHAVSQSFGSCQTDESTQYVWFHLLSKDVATAMSNVETQMGSGVDGRVQSHRQGVQRGQVVADQDFVKDDHTWIKPGFVLKIEHGKQLPRVKPQSKDDENRSVESPLGVAKSFTLFAFGAPYPFLPRFRSLLHTASAAQLLQDPFMLLEIAFDEMHKLMDRVGWRVSDVFGDIEKHTLGKATTPVEAQVNFPRLHNLMKHSIFLRENCDSAINTLDSLYAQHEKYIADSPTSLQLSTRDAFKYRKSMLQSTQGHLSTLDKRMANIVQLSFHLVQQGDSQMMQSEAVSMRMIAVVTLFFMPLATVATVFGTQLIHIEDDAPFHMRVSREFWVLWMIAIPLTGLVLWIWRAYSDGRRLMLENAPGRREDGVGYRGWNRISAMFRCYGGRRLWGRTTDVDRELQHKMV